MRIPVVTMLAICALLAGCAAKDAATGGNSGQPAAGESGSGQATSGDERMDALKPPRPDSVLYVIYRRDGDGAVSYEIDGGATVGYWHGHEFDLNGIHYFTGFASKTNDREGEDGDSEYALEDGRVAISQATFRRVDKGGKPAWEQVDTDGYVGEFGRNDRPEEIDGSRETLSRETGDGRLLLAIPTRDFENGMQTRAYALFLFDPDGVDRLRFRSWGYVGSIAVGSDNSAACDGGAVMACAASTGRLEFGAAGDAGLPRLKVVLEGETVSGPGQVRSLGEKDAVSYGFDANAGQYLP